MPDDRDRFLNRELSWLEFDRRVLALVEDPQRPLLERVRFAAIFQRNLDELFQVRVASLQDQVAAGARRRLRCRSTRSSRRSTGSRSV